MVADLTYTASGVNLDQYADRLGNLGPALNVIGAYAERRVKESIIKGQKLNGQALAPLSPNTVAEKKLRGKARGILRRDGGLLASIAYQRTSATEVQVGTNLEYAPWVILGTDPYTIRSKSADKPLRFYTAEGWRQASAVDHPGLPERNVFEGFEAALGPFVEATLASYLSGGKP